MHHPLETHHNSIVDELELGYQNNLFCKHSYFPFPQLGDYYINVGDFDTKWLLLHYKFFQDGTIMKENYLLHKSKIHFDGIQCASKWCLSWVTIWSSWVLGGKNICKHILWSSNVQ